MIAYANPEFDEMAVMKEKQRDPSVNLGDGYGLIRFNKATRQITFECWPRYADVSKGDGGQYPGWPVTFNMSDNDGRAFHGYLPELVFEQENPVVQVVNEDNGEIIYTQRIKGRRFQPKVYYPATYTVKAGTDRPDAWAATGLKPQRVNEEAVEVGF